MGARSVSARFQMVTVGESIQRRIVGDGFALIHAAFTASESDTIRTALENALRAPDAAAAGAMLGRVGLYGARNVLSLWPDAATVWRKAEVVEALAAVLGPN